MIFLASTDDLRAWLSGVRECGPAPASARRFRVLVPTMGALHEGHLRLIDRARCHADSQETGGEVIVSIFVNPTQFGPNEDLDRYPHTLESDLAACEAHGADAVFAPDVASMYHDDASISIHESGLSRGLCGASRPGHFDGVCTVVAKLFHLTRAHAAVFGEKDYQQLAVVRRMVRDLDFPIEILAEPIVRESDGLAMSSRNRNLSVEQRSQATRLSSALRQAGEMLDAGERGTGVLSAALHTEIAKSNDARIDYVEIVDPRTLAPLDAIDPQQGAAILLAAFFGDTRLIDNLVWMGHSCRHP